MTHKATTSRAFTIWTQPSNADIKLSLVGSVPYHLDHRPRYERGFDGRVKFASKFRKFQREKNRLINRILA